MEARAPAEDRPLVVLPALRTLARGLGWITTKASRLLARGAAAVGRVLWRHRVLVTAILVRGLWVAALLVLVEGGRRLLQIEQPIDPIALRDAFALGLGLCTLTVLLAAQRRIRWAGIALGTTHGALVLVLQTAAG
jgi:hypothetical protein